MAGLGYLIMEDLYLLQNDALKEEKYEISSGIGTVVDWVDDSLKGKMSNEYYSILDKLIKDCYSTQSKGFKGFKECIPVLVGYKNQFEK